jgi:hypothetical protein
MLWLVCGSCYFQSLVSKEEEAREQEKINLCLQQMVT